MITKEEFLAIAIPIEQAKRTAREIGRQANTTALLKEVESALRESARTGDTSGCIYDPDIRHYPFDTLRVASEIEKWGFKINFFHKRIHIYLPDAEAKPSNIIIIKSSNFMTNKKQTSSTIKVKYKGGKISIARLQFSTMAAAGFWISKYYRNFAGETYVTWYTWVLKARIELKIAFNAKHAIAPALLKHRIAEATRDALLSQLTNL